MATSPDFLGLTSSPYRALADNALEGMRDAVVVFDARHRHLPVVLANATARRCLSGPADAADLVQTSLHRWMTVASVSTVERALAATADGRPHTGCVLSWRTTDGETSVLTDIKPLASPSAQRPVMLTFSPTGPALGLIAAVEHLPFEVLLLDGNLRVTYANACAHARSCLSAAVPAGLLGACALDLAPTSALPLDAYARAMQGLPFRDEAVEIVSPNGPPRCFEVELRPLQGVAGIVGLVVLATEVTERRRRQTQEILDVAARERQNIGRDLHDGLGQELTGVALMLQGLARRVQEHCPETAEPVNEIAAVVQRAIGSARSLAHGLLPVRDKGGLAPALQELAARSRDLYGLSVDVHLQVDPKVQFSEAEAGQLYRIAQEALTNAVRHGHPHRVDITLSATCHAFLLCVSDDGEGLKEPKAPYTGMGLKIMKYRAGMIGASFEIVPRKPRGTVVRVIGEQSKTAAPVRPSSI